MIAMMRMLGRHVILPILPRAYFVQLRKWQVSNCCRPVRVRFAPSPTGFLHLGGFRTALLNYIFALKHEGKFILRIEDTDQTRLMPEALQMIEEDLNWLGMYPHEGPSNPGRYGPYIQSQRLSLYQENLAPLIESGRAYECFCTEKRLDLMRREAAKLRQKNRYDNKCRDLTRAEVKRKKAAGEKYCFRFKLEPEHVKLEDLVYGTIEFDLTGMSYEGDPIILKSDGYPTYHFANVVDDHYMEISHVFRGVEWQVSTPKHLQMYRAFNWKPPEFAHLPVVLNKDGLKLSKRQGDISINHYRNQTYYPIALANFVTKSGGGFTHHEVDTLCSMDELSCSFDTNSINTGGCKLDFLLLEKLNQLELQNQVNKNLPASAQILKNLVKSTSNLKVENYTQQYIEKVLLWSTDRVCKLKDLMASDFEYLWTQPNQKLLSQVTTPVEIFQDFLDICQNKLDLDAYGRKEHITTMLGEFVKRNNLKQKTFFKDLRIVLCGMMKGPPIVELFELLGKQIICDRLSNYNMLTLTGASYPSQPNSQAI